MWCCINYIDKVNFKWYNTSNGGIFMLYTMMFLLFHVCPTNLTKTLYHTDENIIQIPHIKIAPKKKIVKKTTKIYGWNEFNNSDLINRNPLLGIPKWHNLFTLLAIRESGFGRFRIHNMIKSKRNVNYNTRSVSTYGLMPKTAIETAKIYKIKLPNDTLKAANILAKDFKLDGKLSYLTFIRFMNIGKKSGLKSVYNQKIFALNSWFYGPYRTKRYLKQHGVKFLLDTSYIKLIKSDIKIWNLKFTIFDI